MVVGDMVEASSQRVCDELREFGAEAAYCLGELSKWENAQRLMAFAEEQFGRIDVLANVAGGTIWFQSFQYYTPEQIQAEIDKSFWTAVWCCRAVLPYMIERKSGAIVNVATHAVTGAFRVPYAAAKAGQIGLTTSLSREVAPAGHTGQLHGPQRHVGGRPGNPPQLTGLSADCRRNCPRKSWTCRKPTGSRPACRRFPWAAGVKPTNRRRPSPSWLPTTLPT